MQNINSVGTENTSKLTDEFGSKGIVPAPMTKGFGEKEMVYPNYGFMLVCGDFPERLFTRNAVDYGKVELVATTSIYSLYLVAAGSAEPVNRPFVVGYHFSGKRQVMSGKMLVASLECMAASTTITGTDPFEGHSELIEAAVWGLITGYRELLEPADAGTFVCPLDITNEQIHAELLRLEHPIATSYEEAKLWHIPRFSILYHLVPTGFDDDFELKHLIELGSYGEMASTWHKAVSTNPSDVTPYRRTAYDAANEHVMYTINPWSALNWFESDLLSLDNEYDDEPDLRTLQSYIDGVVNRVLMESFWFLQYYAVHGYAGERRVFWHAEHVKNVPFINDKLKSKTHENFMQVVAMIEHANGTRTLHRQHRRIFKGGESFIITDENFCKVVLALATVSIKQLVDDGLIMGMSSITFHNI